MKRNFKYQPIILTRLIVTSISIPDSWFDKFLKQLTNPPRTQPYTQSNN